MLDLSVQQYNLEKSQLAAHTKSIVTLLLTAGCQYYSKLPSLVKCPCKHPSNFLYNTKCQFIYLDFKFANAGFSCSFINTAKTQVTKANKSQHDI
jgi:hypothetical protein